MNQLREIKTIAWSDFAAYPEQLFDSILEGDAWILKGAFSPVFVNALKARTASWCKHYPQSFHKMLDGCPDFHRDIDAETGKLYSIHGCKHSAYFFRWNDDPLAIWPTITERWRVIKKAMGLRPTEYENNKPSDGPTDRIQVVKYSPKAGFLEPHRDATEHQLCFISGYLSKRGVDYQGGGFYFVVDGKPVFAEDMIDVGDICIGHANLLHGVAPTTEGERWFLGLYSNASDYEKKRNTAKPERIEIPGVRP